MKHYDKYNGLDVTYVDILDNDEFHGDELGTE